MKAVIAGKLIEINRRFYTMQAGEFAETRRRIQPGVAKVLAGLRDVAGDRWLDLGCGSGWLAVEWLRRGRQSGYCGLDFSVDLLAEARLAMEANGGWRAQVEFRTVDFGSPEWDAGLDTASWAGALCFAVLHHLPGQALRLDFLRRVGKLVRAGGRVWFSVWQFQNSPKLMARRHPWQAAGLDERQVEAGDTLLDWRKTADGAPALRYVHQFAPGEAEALAQAAGLRVVDTFESDGQGGDLGLYVGCEKGPAPGL